MTVINRTIREQITDHIRNELVAGHLTAGEPLREEQLAEQFGTSRGPIRDAFLQLSNEGFLAYEANRGVTVRHPPDENNRAFIVSLRQQIECFIVRQGFPAKSDNEFATLRQKVDNLKTACESKNVVAIANADVAFHEELLRLCNGEDFLPIWRWLCSQMMMTYSRLSQFDEILAEHTEIFEAFSQHKKQATISALKKNIC